ncbi:hypothetical protein B0H11DRAFT_1999975 [Mycena galericulata]|nr:hypothetical protein B0H11DRAFT_1999975 [Mycena galericulata]
MSLTFSEDHIRQIFGSVTISVIAFLTLLSYDLLLNGGAEYDHIWKSKWSLIKCLYLWSRYGPFIDTAIAMLRGSGAVSADVLFDAALTSCNTLTKFNTIFSIFGIGVTEVILIIRTYALYGSSKKVLTFCVVVWLVRSFVLFITTTSGFTIIFTHKSVGGICTWAAITWSESVVDDVNLGLPCPILESSSVLVACYVSLLVGETVIVLLTLWKFVHYKVSAAGTFRSSRLITSFYRDGIIFYVAILVFFIGIVVLQSGLPEDLKLIALTPLRVMHSILACRLVIHVRVVASEEGTGTVVNSKPLLFANIQADIRCGVDTVI